VSSQFSFLFLGYSEAAYFWEALVLLKKACLTLIGATWKRDPHTQILLALFLLTIQMVLHATVMPFTTLTFNRLEQCSLFVSWMTIFVGFYTLKIDANVDDSAPTLWPSMFALVLNIGYIMGASVLAYSLWKQDKAVEKRQTELQSPSSALGRVAARLNTTLKKASFETPSSFRTCTFDASKEQAMQPKTTFPDEYRCDVGAVCESPAAVAQLQIKRQMPAISHVKFVEGVTNWQAPFDAESLP
jgi:hypothetical protein